MKRRTFNLELGKVLSEKHGRGQHLSIVPLHVDEENATGSVFSHQLRIAVGLLQGMEVNDRSNFHPAPLGLHKGHPTPLRKRQDHIRGRRETSPEFSRAWSRRRLRRRARS